MVNRLNPSMPVTMEVMLTNLVTHEQIMRTVFSHLIPTILGETSVTCMLASPDFPLPPPGMFFPFLFACLISSYPSTLSLRRTEIFHDQPFL